MSDTTDNGFEPEHSPHIASIHCGTAEVDGNLRSIAVVALKEDGKIDPTNYIPTRLVIEPGTAEHPEEKKHIYFDVQGCDVEILDLDNKNLVISASSGEYKHALEVLYETMINDKPLLRTQDYIDAYKQFCSTPNKGGGRSR